MGIASKFNKGTGKKFNYEMDGKNFTYVKLSELKPDTTYTIKMFYINKKSKYGDAPCCVLDGNIVNLPKHTLDTVLEIINDAEAVEQINNGKFGIKSVSYEKDGKTLYAPEWVDID